MPSWSAGALDWRGASTMSLLELAFACGEDSLSVHRFSVHEAVSGLFTVSAWATSPNHDLDLEAIVGEPAALRLASGTRVVDFGGARRWSGVCSFIEQVQALHSSPGEAGESAYYLRIVPRLWLLTQRRNYRIYQHLSIPGIIDKLLAEWSITPKWLIDSGAYPKLEYRVQYGESDYSFLSRLLEEAGIAFTFPDSDAGKEVLLGDELHVGPLRDGPPVPYVDNPSRAADKEFVTHVCLSHEVRPGAYTIRDHDFRRPTFPLLGEAKASPPEARYEQYHYQPGSFLVEPDNDGGGPPGAARNEEQFGRDRAQRMLLGERMGRRSVSFETNLVDLWPGRRFFIDHHPHAEVASDKALLVTEFSLEGSHDGEWSMSGRAVFCDMPYRPPQRTQKPRVNSVQTATVVGPKGKDSAAGEAGETGTKGQQIHTDEFGRVRVQFPWDREGKYDDRSSCWIRVSQSWAGTGYGMLVIPRVGNEVLVGFMNGDPDQPIIVGRVFNATQRVPYTLPEHKTRSTWKSASSPGSAGSNEIMFEDLKDRELVYVQAQKNLRKLVKHDETITVGNNRQQFVVRNEIETTGANRTEVTGGNRTEITGADRMTVVGGNYKKLVHGDEIEKTAGSLTICVEQDQDIVIHQVKRERVEGDSHLRVKGKRNQKVDGTQSLSVGKDRHERVGKNHAVQAGEAIHLKAGSALVIEAAQDLTIKGPGGFIRIDAGGVTIRGHLVKINSGGSPGAGSDASPEAPEEAVEAAVEEPAVPEPDNVAVTGLAQ
ncbi:type VI secretion system tip protein TssI/VgrG [Sorangium sp. So ce291]|uniref:type VI secretion system Vgr family protein n=1 Tax=Sorangium sp. So ce291 TaxID=3133294 RepID=UPI003F5F29A8